MKLVLVERRREAGDATSFMFKFDAPLSPACASRWRASLRENII